MILIRALLAVAVVFFVVGLARAISNVRGALSGRGGKTPLSRKADPPYDPGEVVEAQWEDLDKKK
ncbi:MAG: hypothetical protein KAW17_03175 [Candidatus Eisenbacteria sp.]|nr:hypothetical protein [Candidatus Eisenbacteria bacterium]